MDIINMELNYTRKNELMNDGQFSFSINNSEKFEYKKMLLKHFSNL